MCEFVGVSVLVVSPLCDYSIYPVREFLGVSGLTLSVHKDWADAVRARGHSQVLIGGPAILENPVKACLPEVQTPSENGSRPHHPALVNSLPLASVPNYETFLHNFTFSFHFSQ